MSDEPNMLILADEPRGSDLGAQLAGGRYAVHADPYDALTAMGRRRWPAVLLTAPRPDFTALCRATRRLQAEAGIFALCGPGDEAKVRPLVPGILDDYFIYPPGRADVSRLREAALCEAPAQETEQVAAPAVISPEDLAWLINASSSVRALEGCLADMVGRHAAVRLEWVDAAEAPAGTEPLLTINIGQARRVLVPGDPREPPQAPVELLSSLRGYLPSLAAAAKRTESLHHLAAIDHLTKAYNRRYFYHMADQILLRAGRRNLRASLLLFDIDNFKHYNDTYGHASGDEILKDIAALMKGVTRSHDIVARIGGDEFAVLFWDAGRPRTPGSKMPEDAFVLADRFRKAVEDHAFGSLGPEARGVLTISGGLATFGRDGRTCRELLRKADQALRASKESGKNSITLIGAV